MRVSIYHLSFIFLFFIANCASSEMRESAEVPDAASEMPSPSESSAKPSSSIDKSKIPAAPSKYKKDGKKASKTESEDLGTEDSISRSSEETSGGGYKPPPQNSESGLKAGYADDNKQFNYFIGFLEKFKSASHIDLNVSERIFLKVKSSDGKTIPLASVEIKSGSKTLETGLTYSDGSYLFFPSIYPDTKDYKAIIKVDSIKKEINFSRQGNRQIEIKLDSTHQSQNHNMDLLFVMDTTGSMGGEIQRLKSTIELIHLNLSNVSGTKIRFGMVLYKDKGDEYVTKVIPLTSDLAEFQKELNQVTASGGGDHPEDLQSALQESIESIKWDKSALKLAFVITDAPPHLDYSQKFDYIKASFEAKKIALKYFTIGTGGLDINGEYILRQLAQYTYAKYIFLTYGEKGESGGGKPASVSHHTGENFSTDKLESIVINFAREEYALANNKPLPSPDEYFEAKKDTNEKREEVLQQLFDKSISQLNDYSSIKIEKGITLAILPIIPDTKNSAKTGEYFGEQLLISVSKSGNFKLVERKDFQKILEEWKRMQTLGKEEESNMKFGKMTGAKLLLVSRLYKKATSYEVFLKMINSESGEILSVTKLIIATNLGI